MRSSTRSLLGAMAAEEHALPWSTDQTQEMCGVGGEARFQGRVAFLRELTSVSLAVERLNLDGGLCPEGMCVVFSNDQRRYFLLFRNDKRSQAMDLFSFEEQQWSAECSHDLCGPGEEERFSGKAVFFSEFSSISQAVAQLNANSDLCPDGLCVVFSQERGRYFGLYTRSSRGRAFEILNLHSGFDQPDMMDRLRAVRQLCGRPLSEIAEHTAALAELASRDFSLVVRKTALDALCRLDAADLADSAPALAACLQCEHPSVRMLALVVLAKLEPAVLAQHWEALIACPGAVERFRMLKPRMFSSDPAVAAGCSDGAGVLLDITPSVTVGRQ